MELKELPLPMPRAGQAPIVAPLGG